MDPRTLTLQETYVCMARQCPNWDGVGCTPGFSGPSAELCYVQCVRVGCQHLNHACDATEEQLTQMAEEGVTWCQRI